MNRFTILEGNPCAVFDRAEGQTFQCISAAEAIKLHKVLVQQEQLIERFDPNVMAPIRNALEDLVQVKNYKDIHGKDEWYETNRKEAWENARKALEN